MDDRRRKLIRMALVALGAGLALGAVIALWRARGGKEPPAPAQQLEAKIRSRMADPAYRAQLKAQEKERNAILGERARLAAALEEARREDPEGTRARELAASLAATDKAFEDNRQHTMALIRARVFADAQNDTLKQKKGN